MSGRIAATLPFPAAASDLNCFMKLKLLVNELVETLDGPVARTEAEAPPPPPPTSVADKTRESPPSMPALLKRTLSPLVLVRPAWAGPPATAFYPYVAGCIAILLQVRERYRDLWRMLGMPCEDLRSRGRTQAGSVAASPGGCSGQPGVVSEGGPDDRQVVGVVTGPLQNHLAQRSEEVVLPPQPTADDDGARGRRT